jgi:hypothetical protein
VILFLIEEAERRGIYVTNRSYSAHVRDSLAGVA